METAYRDTETGHSRNRRRSPQNSAHVLALLSVITAASAYFIFIVIFAVLWGPVYVTGSEGSLFLFPLAFVALVPMFFAGLAAIVTGAVSLFIRGGSYRSSTKSKIGMASAGLLVVIALPALWFGSFPMLLFGG